MEEEEGEEVQGVQGLLSPGGKVSETPTAVKEMEGGCCFQRCLQGVNTVVTLLCTRVDGYATEVKETPTFYFFKVFKT